MNILAVLVAALVPMVIGMLWYNPKTLGNAWMKETGLTEEELRKANMVKVFGFSVLFSFMLSLILQSNVIHQMGIVSAFFDYEQQIKDPTTKEGAIYKSVMDLVGTGHRTFGHGMFHGIITALFFVLPVIGINSLFERKTFKYIFIHVGYWVITLGIMGGILSAWI